MLKEPAILDININEARDNLLDFLESILNQAPQVALRRGQGQYMQYYVENIKKIPKAMQVDDLSTLLKYRKLALFINKIIQKRLVFNEALRKIRRFLKG